jgi:hypothetical protein
MDMTETARWYCRVFGTDLGPMPFEAVQRMIAMRELDAADKVRCGTDGSWQEVREIASLRPLLKTLPPAANISVVQEVERTADEPVDEWYYKLDDRVRGPFPWAALRDLIGSSGDVATAVAVRRGAEGDWASFMHFTSGPQSGTRVSVNGPRKTSLSVDRLGQAVVFRSERPRERNRTVGEIVRANVDIAAGLTVWFVLNAVVLALWSQSYSTERQYYTTLRQLESQVKAFQSRNASEQEWAAMRDHAKDTLGPIAADLGKSASASTPIRQNLLWAARDYFPRLLGPRTNQMSGPQRLYDRHMAFVERELARH